MSCYIYQLPAWVLDDLCRNMDTLSEWDWMQFASYVITDLTQLRKIKSMERVQGVSITRELLWWWGMRQATVQQLVDLLCRLQLYRAAQIILNWKPVPEIKSSFPDAVKPGRPLAASVRNTEDEQGKGQSMRPAALPGPGPAPARANLLPPSEDAPHSLKTNFPVSSDSKDVSVSIPKQETLLSMAEDSLFWSEADVVQATDNFNQSHKISEGTFADIYKGQRHGTPFVFKKLREVAYSGPGSIEKFFQAEVQVCHRCCHPNVLPLLGFCTGNQFYSLIYPYMANGSLQDRLQGQVRGWIMVREQDQVASRGFEEKPVSKASSYRMWDPRRDLKTTQAPLKILFSAKFCSPGVSRGMVGNVQVESHIPATHTGVFILFFPQKDLLLSEIPSSTTSLCCRKTGVEKVMAKEICQKYLEKRAGRLLEDCAQALAMAACLCLRRRNASLAEVCGSVAAVEERLRDQEMLSPWSGLSESTGSSSNTPEETDDVDNSSLDASYSMRAAPRAGDVASLPPTEGREGRLQADGGTPADSSSGAYASPEPPQDATETSWKIEINEAKRKLMENIFFYKEGKLDSLELFGP
uniref:interleukin-1 receptor-associated kinase-like 2 n=1 Tax=Panthera onca TaxID=9690 RepID=UPI0029554716|nr:interleukin-1 receptor-associated kinase-like 2 [Panthera onca]